MVGYMNEESFRLTVERGYAIFSRAGRRNCGSRGKSSGHKLLVKSIETDCDRDAVLVQVDPVGPGVCHEGYESCFFRTLTDGEWRCSENTNSTIRRRYMTNKVKARYSEG
jgi:phosphoribosyl-AMP cyclohydrolase